MAWLGNECHYPTLAIKKVRRTDLEPPTSFRSRSILNHLSPRFPKCLAIKHYAFTILLMLQPNADLVHLWGLVGDFSSTLNLLHDAYGRHTYRLAPGITLAA